MKLPKISSRPLGVRKVTSGVRTLTKVKVPSAGNKAGIGVLSMGVPSLHQQLSSEQSMDTKALRAVLAVKPPKKVKVP